MIQISLPRLAGTRDAVRDLLEQRHVPQRLAGEAVVVYCRDLASGSPSYADELVRQVLEVRGARELVLVGSPAVFQQRVARAAERRGVAGSVHGRAAAEVLG